MCFKTHRPDIAHNSITKDGINNMYRPGIIWPHSPEEDRSFQTIIGYEPGEDYGFELNNKLFYYFQYVEQVLRIPILDHRPVGVVF